MTPERVRELVDEWRAEAADLQSFGAEGQAKAVAKCADDLELMMAADDDVITLAEAARESRFSADYLGRLIKQGHLKNYGRRHAPRVRRSELPKKATAARSTTPTGGTLPPALVKSAFASRRKAS